MCFAPLRILDCKLPTAAKGHGETAEAKKNAPPLTRTYSFSEARRSDFKKEGLKAAATAQLP
jgi:hypothetical protein